MAIRLDHGEDELTEVHDINVTPFIDVMLVLLIIFMVAAPLATVDVPVDLPSSNAQQQQRPNKPIFVTIKADHTLAIGEDAVTPGDACGGTRRSDRIQQGGAHFPAVRPLGPVWRRHAGARRSAGGELPQSRPGRARNAEHAMNVRALPWFEDDNPRDLARWSVAAAIVVVRARRSHRRLSVVVARTGRGARRRHAHHLDRTDRAGNRSAGAGEGRRTHAAEGNLDRRRHS